MRDIVIVIRSICDISLTVEGAWEQFFKWSAGRRKAESPACNPRKLGSSRCRVFRPHIWEARKRLRPCLYRQREHTKLVPQAKAIIQYPIPANFSPLHR